MGLDKHENEHLIRTGTPTDIWFHVASLSSAHVYVRLPFDKTIEDLAEETVEDMCQLVKNNSIQGSKLSSCKICYTEWGNLKKELVGMDVGTVGFKDYKKRLLRRCDKVRQISFFLKASWPFLYDVIVLSKSLEDSGTFFIVKLEALTG